MDISNIQLICTVIASILYGSLMTFLNGLYNKPDTSEELIVVIIFLDIISVIVIFGLLIAGISGELN